VIQRLPYGTDHIRVSPEGELLEGTIGWKEGKESLSADWEPFRCK